MEKKYVTLEIGSIAPKEETPSKESLISGNPRFKTWNVDVADGGVLAGLWESTPGKVRIENKHWEYCRIISGLSIITEEGGQAYTVKAGSAFVLRAGFKGTWEVVETTRKDYVVRM